MTLIDHRRHLTGHMVKSTSNSYIIAHAELVFLLIINNSIIRTRC